MDKVLLLLCVFFCLSCWEPVAAARPSAYARAKMSGRIYVHRPNYKLYHGPKRQHGLWFGRMLPQRHKAQPSRSRF